MVMKRTYVSASGTSGVISSISAARANQDMDGSLGRAARQYITDWNAAQKVKKRKAALNYGVNIDDYTDSKGNIDEGAYRKAQLAWMSGNSAFDGWSEDDMTGFLDEMQANGWSAQERTAAQMWKSAAIGQRNSNAQKKADREDILAEIEAYKAGFSNEAIETAVAAERQAWDAKIQSTLNQAMNQAAAQGRVLDGSTYAMLRGRLEAQAAAAIQKVQMDYEAKRQEYAYNAMNMKNDVYKNTTNTVMDYSDVIKMIQAMAGK
jgi:hypothetical protein